MSPEDKIAAYFQMLSKGIPDRKTFDEIIHEDFILDDYPAGIKIVGKNALWMGMCVPPEQKMGSDGIVYRADFIEYVGDDKLGYAQWSMVPTVYAAPAFGIPSVESIDEKDAVSINIAARISFKEGKVQHIEEYWNPVPLYRSFGVEIPVAGSQP